MTQWIANSATSLTSRSPPRAPPDQEPRPAAGIHAARVRARPVMLELTSALRHEAGRVLANSPEVIRQRMVAGRHDLVPPGYIERIGRIRGVQQITGRLWGYYYDPVVKANYTFMAVMPAAAVAGDFAVRPVSASEAQPPAAAGEPRSVPGWRVTGVQAGNVLFPLLLRQALLVQGGARAARRCGARQCRSGADQRGRFPRLLRLPGRPLDRRYATVANPQEERTVAQKLANALPDSRPILRDEVLRTYQSIFDWREGIVLALTSAAILAFAICCLGQGSPVSPPRKNAQIGILKAIGWETGDVIRMKLWEGLLISAHRLRWLPRPMCMSSTSATLFAPVLKGWAVLYPKFTLAPAIDGLQIATLFFAVLPYAVAVLVPIWRRRGDRS